MDSEAIAKTAKETFEASQLVLSSERIKALKAIQQELEHAKEKILAANAEDLKVECIQMIYIIPQFTNFCRLPKRR
jgi:glutamate-5-semialdehyde dehydrogenase